MDEDQIQWRNSLCEIRLCGIRHVNNGKDKEYGKSPILFFARTRNAKYSESAYTHIDRREITMKHDDAKILREVQRNTEIGMTTIDTILDKIDNDEFSLQLSKQSLHYSEIHNKALDQILKNEGDVYRGSQITDIMLKGSIHASTALNVSKGHLAEIMIQGSNRGITSMWKAMKHNQLATSEAVELAQELVDFEQENIKQLREYL